MQQLTLLLGGIHRGHSLTFHASVLHIPGQGVPDVVLPYIEKRARIS